MILDSSAIFAILRAETEMESFSHAIQVAGRVSVSAATYLESAVVVDRSGDPVLSRRLDEVLRAANVQIQSVTEAQARVARQAYRDFGKGSGHRAKLNFGDCFSYALAKDLGETLLFKGRDFLETDIEPALR